MLVGNANSCVNPWIYVIFNYKRVWEVLCGGDQRQGSYSQNRAGPSTDVKSHATTIRHQLSVENSSRPPYDYDSPKLTPNAYYVRGRCQNSQGRQSGWRNHNGAARARNLSQTSTISSYSTV